MLRMHFVMRMVLRKGSDSSAVHLCPKPCWTNPPWMNTVPPFSFPFLPFMERWITGATPQHNMPVRGNTIVKSERRSLCSPTPRSASVEPNPVKCIPSGETACWTSCKSEWRHQAHKAPYLSPISTPR